MTVALTYCNYSVWQGKEMLCALVLSGGTPQVAEKREERSSRLVKKFSHFHLHLHLHIEVLPALSRYSQEKESREGCYSGYYKP